jgi:hypothetical protein
MANKVLKSESVKSSEGLPSKPKKLSKAGEWRRAHPNGLDVIYVDMRAILR